MQIDPSLVIELFHHRWNVPVIAELSSSGSRFVALQNRLGASRSALRTSLDALGSAGLVIPNPGYGHPLRPEYVLTEVGTKVAPACGRYRTVAARLGVASVAFRKWTAPLLLVLSDGRTRFNRMQTALGTVTPRALTDGLRILSASRLVNRSVNDGFPPHASYRLTRGGNRLAAVTIDIAARLDS